MDTFCIKQSVLRWGKSLDKYLENINNRKLVIYGEDIYTKAIAKTAAAMGYTIECLLSDSLTCEIATVYPVKQLKYFPSEEYYVLVAALVSHKEAYEHLITNNYRHIADFSIMGIGGYTKPIDAIDSLLGFSRIKENIPGFTVWGGNTENPFKIIILGNSTSDASTGMLKSWPEFLYEIAKEAKHSVTVYNGATTGYCSTQEFLKLNRDVYELNPDLVISLSGYNDINGTSSVEGYPFLHKYSWKFYEFLKDNPRLAPDSMYMRNVNFVSHGIKTTKVDSSIWISNMRKMNAICELHDVKFISYFQPMLECEDLKLDKLLNDIINEFYRLTGIERVDVTKKTAEYLSKVELEIRKYPYIKNLSGLFKEKKDVFYDICHYTEKGNYIIAEKIYQDIKSLFNRKRNEYE